MQKYKPLDRTYCLALQQLEVVALSAAEKKEKCENNRRLIVKEKEKEIRKEASRSHNIFGCRTKVAGIDRNA